MATIEARTDEVGNDVLLDLANGCPVAVQALTAGLTDGFIVRLGIA